MLLNLKLWILSISLCLLSACSITSSISTSLTDSVLNQEDPQLVADAAPTFIVLADALINNDPEDAESLLTGSKLYGAYGGGFVKDKARQKKLVGKAYSYAQRALCIELPDVCATVDKPFDEFAASIAEVDDEDDVAYLYGFGSAWAGLLQSSAGWSDLTAVPKINIIMQQVVKIDEAHADGNAHVILGVLNSQLPPALGGKPEIGRKHFERALELSNDQNLMAKVLFAQTYARLLFDQELHNLLLEEVLQAKVNAPRLTLVNVLAQQRATQLLESGKDYF